jgi:hypothetical protein
MNEHTEFSVLLAEPHVVRGRAGTVVQEAAALLVRPDELRIPPVSRLAATNDGRPGDGDVP